MTIISLTTVTLLITVLAVTVASSPVKPKSKLLVLLIDGLRHDFVNNQTLVGFSSLKNRGVMAKQLIPNFPASGYPNYFSLVTGLYPEQHGITDDIMYDYASGDYFNKGSTTNGSQVKWLVDGEPIWETAKFKDLNTSLYWWPGCHVESKLVPQELCKDIGMQSIENSEKAISTVLDEFMKGDLDISMLHVDEVDFYGHEDTAEGRKYNEAIFKVDSMLQYLEREIQNKSLQNSVNVVVLSVYGYLPMIRQSTIVELTNFLPEFADYLSTIEGGSHIPLYPHKSQVASFFNKMYGRHRHITAYWKWNMPKHWHLRNGTHIAPITLLADPGWIMATSPKDALIHANTKIGYNGYDPNVCDEMKGIFIAAGPDFKKNFSIESISVNDVYNALCLASGLVPASNEGNMQLVNSLIINETEQVDISQTSQESNSTLLDILMKAGSSESNLTITTNATLEDKKEVPVEVGSGEEPLDNETMQIQMRLFPNETVDQTSMVNEEIDESGSGEEQLIISNGYVNHSSSNFPEREGSGDFSGDFNTETDSSGDHTESTSANFSELLNVNEHDDDFSGLREDDANIGSEYEKNNLIAPHHEYHEILDDELMIVEGKKTKTSTTNGLRQLHEKLAALGVHMSVVEGNMRTVEDIQGHQGRDVQIDILTPINHLNPPSALVKVDQYNVENSGKLTKVKIDKPDINIILG